MSQSPSATGSLAATQAASPSGTQTQSSLPFLPGYRVEMGPKDRYHKSHIFDMSNGIRVDMNKEKLESRGVPRTSPLNITSTPVDYRQSIDRNVSSPAATMSRLPAWVAYDRKVLRFSGYFKESVPASSAENWRVRRCLVYFYLEDESMHIAEPKVENSGIVQGVFVKRHRIPKEGSNAFYSVSDLAIGAELPIYGRVFRLTDCDDFTRAFYASNGVQLGEPEAVPADPFTEKQTSAAARSHNKLMNPLKTFMEARLGRAMHAGIEETQKFLHNDGKVLRFYAQWADDKLYGEIRPYILHYFLATDEVEVQEVAIPNSGRDPFPSLLKRQKLPKNWNEVGMDLSRIGAGDDGKVIYVSPADLRVGGTIQVYGRNLLLCGADAFTKQWYAREYGLTDADFPRLNMDDPEPTIARVSPPPHTGFGSEEDSLGSFLYLMPKVPKQDFKKLIELDGVNLRFLAKLSGNVPKVDVGRRFIVTYYLANDSFQIYEKFERNSGFVGGKFLERDRVKNPINNEWYKASDFYVGAKITANKFQFEIIDQDAYTAKFIQHNRHIWGEKADDTTRQGFQGESEQQSRETHATQEQAFHSTGSPRQA